MAEYRFPWLSDELVEIGRGGYPDAVLEAFLQREVDFAFGIVTKLRPPGFPPEVILGHPDGSRTAVSMIEVDGWERKEVRYPAMNALGAEYGQREVWVAVLLADAWMVSEPTVGGVEDPVAHMALARARNADLAKDARRVEALMVTAMSVDGRCLAVAREMERDGRQRIVGLREGLMGQITAVQSDLLQTFWYGWLGSHFADLLAARGQA